jgi:hypothetical protein
MKPWELKEAELLAKENAWANSLSPFMKIIDNHLWFCVLLFFMFPLAFLIGLGIGLLIS